MPATINTVTADKYSDAGGATIQYVYESPGGWCTCNAQVFAQLLHSPQGAQQGQEQWSDEFVLPAGAHYIQRGAIGIRFRSFTAGNPVQVTAAVFYRDEPAMVLGGSGIATPTSSVASLNFQHNDIAVATEPTADFEDAAGANNLIWTVVDDVANTRVKITPTWANPTTFPFDVGTGATSISVGAGAGNALHTTGTIAAAVASTAGALFTGTVTGDTVGMRFRVLGDGSINWGPGNAAQDLTIARLVTGGVTALNVSSTGTQGITIGAIPNSFANLGWTVWSSVQETIGSAAGNNVFVSAVQADTNFRFLITVAGTMTWGPGNAGIDCALTRATTNPAVAHLWCQSSLQVQGSIYNDLLSSSPVPTTSVTPNYSTDTSFIYSIGGTGGGTLTVNNPSNPPASTQTGWMYIQISNPPGNTATALAWGGAFSFLAVGGAPTTVAQAGFWRLFFVWNGASWMCLVKANA